MSLANLLTAYFLGLATPLTAACVLPLYPGFISFLASRAERARPWMFGLLVTAGILVFMGGIGLVFSTLLGISLSAVTAVISPLLFAVLAVISALLVFDIDFSRYLPSIQTPQASSPYTQSFLFGLFFGGIVLPCNPGFIAALLTTTTLSASPGIALGSFTLFGIGMATPLIALSVMSSVASKRIVQWLSSHKTIINRVAGGIMLVISLYYLLVVFRVWEAF